MPWQPCTVCEEDTTNYCKHCARKNQDGTLSARFYCDIECRKKDEVEHLKVHMNALQTTQPIMERASKAGRIAQSLFYLFMENTWTYDMRNVRIKRDQGDDLVAVEVTDGAGVVTAPGGHTDCTSYAGGWLIKFPSECFTDFDHDAMHALLVDGSSTWAFVAMHAAVQALFQDLVEDVQTDIKEVVHYPTPKATRFVHAQGTFGSASRRHDQLYPDEDEHGLTKSVYEITLKCGTRIALDLAGAQWDLQDCNGPHNPVTPWSNYSTRWITTVKYRIPFRSHVLKHTAKLSSYRVITSQTLIMETVIYFNILMTSGLKAELGFHPHQLLEMDMINYHASRQRLLKKTEHYLQKRPKELDIGDPRDVLGGFDLRHPVVIASTPKGWHAPKRNGSLPADIGDMQSFDWKDLSWLIRQPSSQVSFKEKKAAKRLLEMRSVYKEGTWGLVFLDDTLPAAKVKGKLVSENPGWKLC